VKGTSWSTALTILTLLLPALSGCATVEKCRPSPCDQPVCADLPACSRNRVFVFLLAGFDPLDEMSKLREGIIEHGFIKVYCAPRPRLWYYVKEIRRLHEADPDARFVIVAQGGAAVTARWVAEAAGPAIDLMVFLDKTGEGPAQARKVVFICDDKACAEDDKVAELTVRLSDADGWGMAKHPQTAVVIANLLCSVGATIPIVEVGPKCELADCPPCGGGWDFLRPDGHDSGCVGCKPMAQAAALPPAPTAPAAPPAKLPPPPKADNRPLPPAPARVDPKAAPQPTPSNKTFVLPPPPTRQLPPP
jgi:hypothetical protein